MRKITILFIIFLVSNLSKAQDKIVKSKDEIDVSYYSTHIGSNVSVEYNKNVKKHSFILGLKYHLNYYIKPTENGGYVYFKQFYAHNFAERFGASLGYEYHLKDINPYVSPYLLFNSQFVKMKTLYRTISQNVITEIWTDGPFVASENTIGLGLSIKLNDRFNLNQSAGIGSAFFLKNGSKKWDWEVMYQWRAGISIKLN